MVAVSFCLLPVIATGLRFSALEMAVTTGVLHLTRVVAGTLAACSSIIVLSTMSIGSTATTGWVFGLSQNNKWLSLP